MTPPRLAGTARLRGRTAVEAASLGLVLAIVLPWRPAGAVQSVQTGSWWRSQPDGAPVPPPPQVPDGGLWVASDAAGPSAVSAVRFGLDGGESSLVLRLRVHSNQSSGPPAVVACSTTGPWQPATAGAWSNRPASDCGRGKVAGVLSDDATTMTFDLTPLASGSEMDVVLQPPPQEPAATPPPSPVPGLPSPPAPPPPSSAPAYDLTFERPTGADVTVTSAPAQGSAGALTPPESPASVTPGSSIFAPSSAFVPAASALGPTATQPLVPGPASLGPVTSTPAPSAALDLRRAAAPGSSADRVVAGAAFVALALWAWRVMSADADRAGGSLLPRLTLYDAPEAGVAEDGRPSYSAGPRLGMPPALR